MARRPVGPTLTPDGTLMTTSVAGSLPSEVLELLDSRPAWHADAACLEHPEVDFFPSGRGDDAKAVCAGCLVRDECLAAALVRGEHDGIWGGTSERQRRALRRGSAA